MTCPVCESDKTNIFARISEANVEKQYWKCDQCQARFIDPRHLLSDASEHAHYLHHQNHIKDPGYRNFLQKVCGPLLGRLKPASKGLDYGCGPGPALAAMLEEAGHHLSLYDPYFYPDEQTLADSYDFITCTETAEHFYHPAQQFKQLNKMLRPGGLLAVMTCFQTVDEKFATWHYRRDPTHVVFYREETFNWLAHHHGWSCEIVTKDVVIMQKSQ